MPSLLTTPVHLGLGGKVLVQPEFSGMDWYTDYGARVAADGAEGRLVAMGRWTENWGGWEMHPAGDELVVCIEGSMTVHQEQPDGSLVSVTLGPGDYAINPPGIWHTADVTGSATALFVTSGLGTQNRPRSILLVFRMFEPSGDPTWPETAWGCDSSAATSRACAFRLRKLARSCSASLAFRSASLMAAAIYGTGSG